MKKDEQQIEQNRRKRFEVMAVRLANQMNLSQADDFSALPTPIREHFESLRYCDIVRRLIQADHAEGHSLRRLAIKYGISKTAVANHIKK